MAAPRKPIPWKEKTRPTWLDEVTRWIGDTCSALGLGSVTAIDSVRERPWGAVLRATTPQRLLYFKAEGLGGTHEPRVLIDLGPLWPDIVPEVLAVNHERGWMLMSDHGQPMWDVAGADEQLEIYERLLPVYAHMQASTTASLQSWIDAGAPDRRMARVPELLDRMLAGEMWGGPLPIDDELRTMIEAILPTFERICLELADSPVAEVLDHGDLHGGNVLVSTAGHRLCDWGDSCITHPFASLFVTYQVSMRMLDIPDKVAPALRLRDAYLESWTTGDSVDELRSVFTLAMWTAHVTRALDFIHMLDGSDPEMVAEWHGYILDMLREWCEDHALLVRGDELIASIVSRPFA